MKIKSFTIQIIPEGSKNSFSLKLSRKIFFGIFYGLSILFLILMVIIFNFSNLTLKAQQLKSCQNEIESLKEQQAELNTLKEKFSVITQKSNQIEKILFTYFPHTRLPVLEQLPENEKILVSKNQLEEYSNKISELINQESSGKSVISKNFILPLQGLITREFSKNHLGIDLVSKQNNLVIAPYNGIVISLEYTHELGTVLKIQHPKNKVSLFGHLQRSYVEIGDFVKKGEPIASTNDESNQRTHLHYQVFLNSKPIDPLTLIR